jgi:iron complex outermembrane receptor protein
MHGQFDSRGRQRYGLWRIRHDSGIEKPDARQTTSDAPIWKSLLKLDDSTVHDERTIQMDTTNRRYQFPGIAKLLLALTCLAVLPTSTYAQDSGNDKSNPSTATEDNKYIVLEPTTITVTARKEPEPALSIPLSVTAVTDATMINANIQTVKQAGAYAPNAFINEFTSRAISNPFFRGIGGSPTNPGVSTFIDGVPQLHGASSNIEMVDVGQIEFVRGPEGALYGRNTAGGLISITSRSPSEIWATQTQAAFGNYSFRDVRGLISSPLLKDRFSFNLAGGYSGRDGYTKNDLTNQDLDKRAAGFGKGQLFFKLNDRLKLRWILSGERDRDGDYALGDLGYIRANPNHVSRDFQGYTHRSVGSTTFIVDYRGSALDVSSTTGGVWWKNHSLTDLDYQTATLQNGGLYAIRDNVDRQHQFTQEVRLSSSKDKPLSLASALDLSWQTGLFVFKQNYQQDAANDISSIYGFFPRMLSTSFTNLDDWGLGIYGQAKFTAWKKLDVTGGLRFDHEDKSAGLGSSRPTSSSLSGKFSQASPQFSILYRFTSKQMAYGSVSRGYRAGGFNPAPAGAPAPAGTESYGAEHTWNYELGHKASWLGNRLESTVALFWIDWKNLQLNQQIPYSGGQYYIGNAGAANSKGIEVETKYKPFVWWELFGMAGYTHARFLSGSNAFNANLGVNQPVAGNDLPYAPTYTANMGTQVSRALGRYARLSLRVQVSMFGDFQYDASNAMGQPNYSLTTIRGSVRSSHWFAEGWADNAFNAHYVPIAIPYAQLGAPSGYVGESGAPVTYGVRAGITF